MTPGGKVCRATLAASGSWRFDIFAPLLDSELWFSKAPTSGVSAADVESTGCIPRVLDEK